jgi:hypothetical protein
MHSIPAPIFSNAVKNPVRVGFAKTRFITITEFGTIAVAAAKNAAVDGSPGTDKLKDEKEKFGFETVAVKPSIEISAPSPVSIFSVWLRDNVDSVTEVFPLAPSPANNTADFT